MVMGSGASGGGCVSLPPWCSVLGALPCGVSSVLAPFMWDWVVAAGATPGRSLGCAWGRLARARARWPQLCNFFLL